MTLWNNKVVRPISELKFVNVQPIFRSQCSGSKKLRRKSIDELVTSRSITGQPELPDFDMHDAMIASALKKQINTQSNFRKRVSVEEQRVQNSDRFLRGRQIAYMIYEYFRAAGAYEAVQGDFDVRWDRAVLSASEMPSDVILEGLYKSKLQDPVQLQTVLPS